MRPSLGRGASDVPEQDQFGGSGVSPDWALMRQILSLLAGNDGLADTEIADQLGASLADVRQAARILYRQRRIDMCVGYLVAVPSRTEGRRAA
jgi:hypothetical protein